jgi:hypothetical protein
MKLVTEPGTSFAIDDKRFYVPGTTLEGDCPNCKKPVVIDFEDHYLAYPTTGEDFPFTCWCRECSHEWKVTLRLDVALTIPEAKPPIDVAIRNALIERGWGIDPDAKENPSGELHEFIHPETRAKRAWLDAVFDQEKREST